MRLQREMSANDPKADMVTAGCAISLACRVRCFGLPVSGLDWFPTFVAAAGNPNIVDELKGKQIGDRTYKVHLDGYDQTDLISGKGPSKRNEIWYFTETTLSALRIGDYKYRFTDQPAGWFGNTVKVDFPILVNVRLDPFERTGLNQSLFAKDWWAFQFWRFVFVQQEVAKLAGLRYKSRRCRKAGASIWQDSERAD